jgi:hypothetical protein
MLQSFIGTLQANYNTILNQQKVRKTNKKERFIVKISKKFNFHRLTSF